jgi:hypothetical protein
MGSIGVSSDPSDPAGPTHVVVVRAKVDNLGIGQKALDLHVLSDRSAHRRGDTTLRNEKEEAIVDKKQIKTATTVL